MLEEPHAGSRDHWSERGLVRGERHVDRRRRDEPVLLACGRALARHRTASAQEARAGRDGAARPGRTVAAGSDCRRTRDPPRCRGLRGWPGWLLAGALAEV